MLEPTGSFPEAFRFLDSRQERIFGRLLLVGPGPAYFFRDACRLMALEVPLETTTHLVSHLLREIESSLRDVLEPHEEGHGEPNLSSGTDDEHSREILGIMKGLLIPEGDPIARAWLGLAGKGNSYGLAARAHRDSLARPRLVDHEFTQFWLETQVVLDAVLEKFESHYLSFHQRIDELVEKRAPTRADARALRNEIPNSLVTLGYFFNTASAAWLEPLWQEGFFRAPPPLDPGPQPGTITFRHWPESRYLARIAGERPQEVLDIVLQIPQTANIFVPLDLTTCAQHMPPPLAAELVPKAVSWLRSNHHPLLPGNLGVLVAHLARGGQLDSALELAQELLAVSAPEESTGLAREAKAHFPPWDYGQIIEKYVPDLIKATGERGLRLLCDLLNAAVDIHIAPREHKGPGDYSHIWRPKVEMSEPNQPSNITDVLVSAVRCSAEQIAGDDPSKVEELVRLLEERKWRIFHRIALYLLSRFPEAAPKLVAERLASRERFDDIDLRHEYALLARRCFGTIPPEEQATILSWIDQGPDIQRYRESVRARTGEPASQNRSERYARYWRRDRLALLGDGLPPEWKRRYQELVTELGEPEHPDQPTFMSVGWSPSTEVIPADRAASMTVEEIVSFLSSWTPSGEFMAPSYEDVPSQLRSVVAARPAAFAAEAQRFQGLDPSYVAGFLWGMGEAAKQGVKFGWFPVLDLCRWVVIQLDIPQPVEGDRRRDDKPWRQAKEFVANLVSQGLGSGDTGLPFSLRATVWEVLRPLTETPDPTPEDELTQDGSPPDPIFVSMNSTRGEAMRAVIRYALWVRRHLELEPNGKARTARGFDEMPEVREVLDRHLNPKHDPSLAIRSVYGQYFPQLVLLNAAWASQRVTGIFPKDEDQCNLRDAAWNAYITLSPAYYQPFDLLQNEYARAIDQVGAGETAQSAPRSPEERLAEHLLVLYWRGKLSLEERGGLLERFYLRAPDELRGRAIAFVGRSAGHTKGAIAPVILARFQALWTHRLDAAGQAKDQRAFASEMAAFGWWVASRKFDDSWLLRQLKEALKIAGHVEVDHVVAERLAELAPSVPTLAIECLTLMVDGDREGWHVSLWREHIRRALSLALRSSDSVARRMATDLINRLAARGYLEFAELVSRGGC